MSPSANEDYVVFIELCGIGGGKGLGSGREVRWRVVCLGGDMISVTRIFLLRLRRTIRNKVLFIEHLEDAPKWWLRNRGPMGWGAAVGSFRMFYEHK